MKVANRILVDRLIETQPIEIRKHLHLVLDEFKQLTQMEDLDYLTSSILIFTEIRNLNNKGGNLD